MESSFQIHRQRAGASLGVLHGVRDEVRVEEVNGEDSLTLCCLDDVAKGDRLLLCDRAGRWHEYRVTGTSLARLSGVPYTSVTASCSMEELVLDYVVDKRPGVRSATTCRECLEAALSASSSWVAGAVDVKGTGGLSIYHTNALAAVRSVAELFGAEVRPTVEVSGSAVAARRVDMLARLGARTGKRFEYRKDLTACTRTVDSAETYTAVYAWGMGEALEGGAYGRRIGIADVNGGVPYVVARGSEGLRPSEHRFGEYVDDQCQDPARLRADAQAWADVHSEPAVSYELSVVDLSAYGMEWEGVQLGDDVQIVDDDLGVEAQGRVLKISWRDLDPTHTEVCVGNVRQGLEDVVASQSSWARTVASSAASWNAAASASGAYVSLVRKALNAAFAEAGSYVYLSDSDGLVCSTVPLDAAMRPTSTPASAVQVARGMLRIADGVASDGTFAWSTYGTGSGLVADAVTAGTIRGGANTWNLDTGDLVFEQGTIRSADGKSWWNLTTGEVHLTATVDGSPTAEDLSEVADAAKRALEAAQDVARVAATSVEIAYALGDSPTKAPMTGWSTGSPSWAEGKYVWQRTRVTVDGTTSESCACIQGASGRPGTDGADGTSVTILGTYGTAEELAAAHPTGERGDGYIVGGDLLVWDGSAWTDVGAVRGPKGDQGSPGRDGAAGRGVSSSKDQWYLSTSSTALVGGSWSDRVQEWAEGRYYWRRAVTAYDDGTTAVGSAYYDAATTQAVRDAVAAEASAGKAVEEVGKVTGRMSTLEQTVEGIETHVSETYATSKDLDGAMGAIETLSTSVVQTAEDVTASITRQSEELEAVRGEMGSLSDAIGTAAGRIDAVTSYVRLGQDAAGNATLDLGTSANGLAAQLTNESLRFSDAGVVVAYINGQRLYISTAEVTQQMVMGQYSWVPSSGHLSLKYTG